MKRPCLQQGCRSITNGFYCQAHQRTPFASAKENYRRLPEPTRQAVLTRDNHACVWCKSTDRPQVDHITPQSRGGSDDMMNLRTLCTPCHRRHTGRTFGWLASGVVSPTTRVVSPTTQTRTV